jgi:hypothetical protein
VSGPGRLGIGTRLLLAVEVTATYLATRWTLRRMPIEPAIERLRGYRPAAAAGNGALTAAERRAARRLARATLATLALLPADSRCLYRSVVLTALLARRSIDSSVVVGVRTDPKFEAHAWVECCGRPLLPDSDFARLTAI